VGYSNARKLGRRKVEAAADTIIEMQQRLCLMEQIIVKLLARENLVLGNLGEGTFDLVPAPPKPASSELEITVLDEAAA